MDDRWAKLEEIVRKVVREELSTWNPQKQKSKIGFKNGYFTGLGEIEMAALEATYPGIDVKKEIRNAATWIVMNPNDAPRSNFGGYLNTWLRKHQMQHSLRSIPSSTQQQPKKACAYCSADSTGTVGGIPCCASHVRDALDGKPRRMLGVIAAPVAGRD